MAGRLRYVVSPPPPSEQVMSEIVESKKGCWVEEVVVVVCMHPAAENIKEIKGKRNGIKTVE